MTPLEHTLLTCEARNEGEDSTSGSATHAGLRSSKVTPNPAAFLHEARLCDGDMAFECLLSSSISTLLL